MEESDILLYYTIMMSSPGEETRYINLGTWQDDPPSYHDACESLATMLGQSAPFLPGDEILDVGFGFGEQDVFWARRFRPKRIVGLNLHEGQVAEARRYVAEHGVQDVVDLRVGNATIMDFDDNSFDKVVALECACNFITRERFFREAFRVLRPGGCLVTADVTTMTTEGGWDGWMMKQTMEMIRVPEENRYTRTVYAELLEDVGFEPVTTTSIRNQVYLPFFTYLARRLRTRPKGTLPVAKDGRSFWQSGPEGDAYRRTYATTLIPLLLMGGFLSNKVTEPFMLGVLGRYAPDYILARAVKPLAPRSSK